MASFGLGRTVAAALIAVIVVVASFVVYESFFATGPPTCLSLRPGPGVRGQASMSTFGGVTEYKLAGQDRWPNAVTSAPDGTVWFVEQDIPGVAHLFPRNGTVVEYAWPGYTTPKLPDCLPVVNASGIAIWNGRVWAADEFGNAIVGVSPSDGSTLSISTSPKATFPYWLAVGPDDSLWFTSDNTPPLLGRIGTDMNLSTISLNGLRSDQPLQLVFINSTLAYLATVNQTTNSTTHACVCNGHIYSFNPSSVGPTLTPNRVGDDHRLILPTSTALSGSRVWVAQHATSSVVSYDVESGHWAVYPTSLVSWTDTTLPLVVQSNSAGVWFNEHLANKIALINPSAGTLTEFSESNPPASGAAGIQNDLSISATPNGLWFTSLSGNYVGFVDAAWDPGFRVSASGTNHATVGSGGNTTLGLRISGTWSGRLTVNTSDSENPRSVPTLIKIVPSIAAIAPSGGTAVDFSVKVEIGQTVLPGSYTLAVTLSDGIVQQSAYLFVDVT